MKRSDMLKLIANQLDFLNGRFHGLRLRFTDEELKKADVILTTLEQAGMQPPNITLEQLIPGALKVAPEAEKHFYACWEPESETDSKDQRAFWDDDNRGSGAV